MIRNLNSKIALADMINVLFLNNFRVKRLVLLRTSDSMILNWFVIKKAKFGEKLEYGKKMIKNFENNPLKIGN